MKKHLLNAGISFLCIPAYVSGQTTGKTPKGSFFPLNVGNYWVFTNPESPGKTDTITINESKIVDTDTAFDYNGTLLFERNDTVYQYQRQRGGGGFPSVQYFPSAKKIQYSIVIGGDAVTQRTVRKVKHAYLCQGKTYTDCYEFKRKVENGFEYIIISRGIGIVEINYPGHISRLVSYKIN